MNPPDVPTAAARVEAIRQQLFMLEAYIALFDRLDSDAARSSLSCSGRCQMRPIKSGGWSCRSLN